MMNNKVILILLVFLSGILAKDLSSKQVQTLHGTMESDELAFQNSMCRGHVPSWNKTSIEIYILLSSCIVSFDSNTNSLCISQFLIHELTFKDSQNDSPFSSFNQYGTNVGIFTTKVIDGINMAVETTPPKESTSIIASKEPKIPTREEKEGRSAELQRILLKNSQ